MMQSDLTILSLFDGMSTGQTALRNLGFKIKKYYASEIKPYAIELTKHHYPDTIQLGDVRKWEEWDIDWKSIDLIFSGSPCQDLSIAGKRAGIHGEKSGLFWTFIDILNHVKKLNPNVKFLQENVGSASKKDVGIMSRAMGVYPVRINSNLLTAQNRDRLYWFGQNRERFYFDEYYCYICNSKRENYENKIKTISRETSSKRESETNKKRENDNEKSRFKFIKKMQKENEDTFKKGDGWNYSSEYGRFISDYENGEEMRCVCCGKRLNNRPYNSSISWGNKRVEQLTSTLSKVQFEQTRQNNGRIFEVYPIGKKGTESLLGEECAIIPQPKDKGIFLKDIIESGEVYNDKARAILERDAKSYKCSNKDSQTKLIESRILKGKQLPTFIKEIIQINPLKEFGGQPRQQNRVYDVNGIYPCLVTKNNGMIAIVKENTKKGFIEVHQGDCVDLGFPKSKTRRGRLMKEKSNCLMESRNEFYHNNVYYLRLLTQTELERLQGFPDGWTSILSYNKASSLLGDGWTLPVIEHILSFMK